MMPFERLEAWRAAHRLTLCVYRITRCFPKEEMFGITSQTRRSAVSIPSNITEGAAKRGNREFRRYLDIALGSFSELTYLIMVAGDLDFLDDADWQEVNALRETTGKLLWGLYRSMGKRETRSDGFHAFRPSVLLPFRQNLGNSLHLLHRVVKCGDNRIAPSGLYAER